MDGCLSVEREIDKLLSKISSYSQAVSRNRIESDHVLDCCKEKLQTQDLEAIPQHCAKLKTVAYSMANDHKELHTYICKIGKAIDKNFVAQDGHLLSAGFLQDDEKKRLVHQVMCDHLVRQGHLEVAKSLIEESQIPMRNEQKELFTRVSDVINALKLRNIEPCVRFVEEFRFQLSAISSSLEFYLLKLRFMELVSNGNRTEALSLSTHFSKFTPKHTNEIQQLMGLLIYGSISTSSQMEGGGITGSNKDAKTLVDDSAIYNQLIDILTGDLCTMVGFSQSEKSHLSTCIESGCQFLPSLINLKQVMTQGKIGSLWNVRDELPIEINLKLCQYHSLVACPILRQPTNDDNPAMRLFCGHIISKEALNKISSTHSKMKCPYCPVEQSAKNALVINF